MRYERIDIRLLEPNRGQVEGLPKNPRKSKDGAVDELAQSIEETPLLTEARGCIVLPKEGKYIIVGGNLRYAALKKLGCREVDCSVLPEDTPAAKLREIALKDNGSWGQWDFDMLANEWDEDELRMDGLDFVPAPMEEPDYEEAKQEMEREVKQQRERIIITYCAETKHLLEEIIGMEIADGARQIKIEDVAI